MAPRASCGSPCQLLENPHQSRVGTRTIASPSITTSSFTCMHACVCSSRVYRSFPIGDGIQIAVDLTGTRQARAQQRRNQAGPSCDAPAEPGLTSSLVVHVMFISTHLLRTVGMVERAVWKFINAGHGHRRRPVARARVYLIWKREGTMPATDVGTSEDLLAELSDLGEDGNPDDRRAAVNRLMDVAERELSRAGAAITRIPGRDGYGDNLIARHARTRGSPILVAGHLDTVWSHGTLKTMPYFVNGKKAHGPGIYDMKAGSFLAFHAVRSILQQDIKTPRPIVLLLTPDEEVGSPTSRWLIEQEAAQAAMVLIPEPAGAGGACVTARKGVGRFTMRVEGRGSHAGTAFEDGASAIVELSHQIIGLHRMVDIERGITLNAAPIWGGTRPNVISPDAGCEIDLRVNSAADGVMMEERLLGLTAKTPGLPGIVKGGMNRPPYTESPAISALYAHAQGVAQQVGLALPKQHRGGGSDGNFSAALRRADAGWPRLPRGRARMPATSTSCGDISRNGQR